MDIIVRSGSKYAKDAHGDRVDFKKPYFDKAARRVFKTAEEKSAYMIKGGWVQNGDSDEKVKRQRREAYERKMDEQRR